MSRTKLIALFVILTLTAVLLLLVLKIPSLKVALFPDGKTTSADENQTNESKSIDPAGLIEGVKNLAIDTTQQAVNRLTGAINDKKDDLLTQFAKENPAVIVSTPSKPQGQINELITLDLSGGNQLNIKAKKGQKYHILFKNVPLSTCFYIGDLKYKIEENLILTLEFQNTGNFKLQTNSCDLNFKELGTVEVE